MIDFKDLDRAIKDFTDYTMGDTQTVDEIKPILIETYVAFLRSWCKAMSTLTDKTSPQISSHVLLGSGMRSAASILSTVIMPNIAGLPPMERNIIEANCIQTFLTMYGQYMTSSKIDTVKTYEEKGGKQ